MFTIKFLREQFLAKKITPLAVVEEALAKIAKEDGEIHAFLAVYDDAKELAKQATAVYDEGKGKAHPTRAARTSASPPAATEPMRQPYWLIPEPTPNWRGFKISIRYASMTMSKVAPAAPTSTAA